MLLTAKLVIFVFSCDFPR